MVDRRSAVAGRNCEFVRYRCELGFFAFWGTDQQMTRLRDHVLGHIPRCLADVCTEPCPSIENYGSEWVAFRLSSAAGSNVGEILGYDLRDYNREFDGSCEFISPLMIQWPDSPRAVIFDSHIHGYHGEMQSSANCRGAGEPAPYICPQCGGKNFVIRVQFDYWGACYDLWEDEPEIMIEDYFNNIAVSGECVTCRHISRVLDMDI